MPLENFCKHYQGAIGNRITLYFTWFSVWRAIQTEERIRKLCRWVCFDWKHECKDGFVSHFAFVRSVTFDTLIMYTVYFVYLEYCRDFTVCYLLWFCLCFFSVANMSKWQKVGCTCTTAVNHGRYAVFTDVTKGGFLLRYFLSFGFVISVKILTQIHPWYTRSCGHQLHVITVLR